MLGLPTHRATGVLSLAGSFRQCPIFQHTSLHSFGRSLDAQTSQRRPYSGRASDTLQLSGSHCRWQPSGSRGSCLAHAAGQVIEAFNDPEIPNGDSERRGGKPLPTQGDSIVRGPDDGGRLALQEREDDGPLKGSGDLDYLAELIAMQQDGPKEIAFFGTRNMGWMHQQLIEVLSYAMVLTGNHIYTSGATGTNAAVIRGALRAEKPELLTVVLPQSLELQPSESRDLLAEVKNVISKPEADHLSLLEASRICNQDIVSRVKQVICFAFHDSRLLLETCREASETRRVVALFYLD